MDPSKANEIPPCNIKIDKEGRWFYQGAEIIKQEIVRHFYAHLESDDQGRVIIHWRGERCVVEADDAPFVVLGVTNNPSSSPGESIEILLNDGSHEELDPDTLWIDEENVPYCRVRRDIFTARFSRKAYYQLARYFEEDPSKRGRYYISLRGKRHFLKINSPTKG
jgi:hypothetical protein